MIEIFAEQVRPSVVAVEVGRLAHGLLSCAEVVNRGIERHVRLEVDAILQTVHDTLHTPLEVVPRADDVVLGRRHRRWRRVGTGCFLHFC